MAIHIKRKDTASGCLVSALSLAAFAAGLFCLFEGNAVIGVILIVVGVVLEKISDILG